MAVGNSKYADRLGVSLRPIRTGESYAREVEGGFSRYAVGDDGILVVTAERDIFLPLDMLGPPLAALGIALVKTSVEVAQAPAPSPPVRAGRIRLAKTNKGASRG